MPTAQFWMRNAMASDGALIPESRRQTTAVEAPISRARSACDQPKSLSRSRNLSTADASPMCELLPGSNSLSSCNDTPNVSRAVALWQRSGVNEDPFSVKLRRLIDAYVPERSQAEFARRLGVHPALVNRWLQGPRLPDAPTFLAIAEFFHMNPFDLIGSHRRPLPSSTTRARRRGRPKRSATSAAIALRRPA